MDGLLDMNRPTQFRHDGDFYAEEDEVTRGTCLDSFFPAEAKGKSLGFEPFETCMPPRTHTLTFPGATSYELTNQLRAGRTFVATGAATPLLKGLLTFFADHRDAVVDPQPNQCAFEVDVCVQHCLLRALIEFHLIEGQVAFTWSRMRGDGVSLVQTAQAACDYLKGCGLDVGLADAESGDAPLRGLPCLAPGLAPGLAPPSFGLAMQSSECGASGDSVVLAVPPCTEQDLEPVIAMAADPDAAAEGCVQLVKLLDSDDAPIATKVLGGCWGLVESLLQSAACVLCAPLLVEKLLEKELDEAVSAETTARLAEVCLSRMASEPSALGRRQLARLLVRMLTLVDTDCELSQLDACCGGKDVATERYLSEARLALVTRQPL